MFQTNMTIEGDTMWVIFSGKLVRNHLHQFLDHYTKLSKEDCYNRFFNTMSPDAIRNWLLSMDEADTKTFITHISEHQEMVCIAEMTVENNQGEIVISVLPEARGKGLGKKAINMLKNIAENKHVEKISFQCEFNNIACRSLFESCGFQIKYDQDNRTFYGWIDYEPC